MLIPASRVADAVSLLRRAGQGRSASGYRQSFRSRRWASVAHRWVRQLPHASVRTERGVQESEVHRSQRLEPYLRQRGGVLRIGPNAGCTDDPP